MANTNQQAKIEQAMKIEKAGVAFIRYGLAIVLIWIGILKFTPYEAQGIQPLVANSPFFSWLYPSLGVRGFSYLLGTVEIALGLLICCRPFMPKISAWAALAALSLSSSRFLYCSLHRASYRKAVHSPLYRPCQASLF